MKTPFILIICFCLISCNETSTWTVERLREQTNVDYLSVDTKFVSNIKHDLDRAEITFDYFNDANYIENLYSICKENNWPILSSNSSQLIMEIDVDGRSQINMEEQRIKEWINNCIQENGWENQTDLHLDDISDKYQEKQTWINGSFELLALARKILNGLEKTKSIVAFVILPLYSDQELIGLNFSSLDKAINEMDITPPSLFICPFVWDNISVGYTNYWEYWSSVQYENEEYNLFYVEEEVQKGSYIRYIALTHSQDIFQKV